MSVCCDLFIGNIDHGEYGWVFDENGRLGWYDDDTVVIDGNEKYTDAVVYFNDDNGAYILCSHLELRKPTQTEKMLIKCLEEVQAI